MLERMSNVFVVMQKWFHFILKNLLMRFRLDEQIDCPRKALHFPDAVNPCVCRSVRGGL